ncbi:MAG: hypothetical protein ABJA98_33790 [Acidobacteriota bacterium]
MPTFLGQACRTHGLRLPRVLTPGWLRLAVPRVTFTDPEVASVGLSAAAARARCIDVAVATADPPESVRGYIHDFLRRRIEACG